MLQAPIHLGSTGHFQHLITYITRNASTLGQLNVPRATDIARDHSINHHLRRNNLSTHAATAYDTYKRRIFRLSDHIAFNVTLNVKLPSKEHITYYTRSLADEGNATTRCLCAGVSIASFIAQHG